MKMDDKTLVNDLYRFGITFDDGGNMSSKSPYITLDNVLEYIKLVYPNIYLEIHEQLYY